MRYKSKINQFGRQTCHLVLITGMEMLDFGAICPLMYLKEGDKFAPQGWRLKVSRGAVTGYGGKIPILIQIILCK